MRIKGVRSVRWVLLPGIALQGGCLAALEQGLDLVFRPEAFANALVLPFSPLLPLAQLVNLLR